MNLNLLFLIWVLSAYRITRFFIRDTIIEAFRFRLHDALLERAEPTPMSADLTHKQGAYLKAHELLSCPACLSVWVSAAVLAGHRILVGPFPIPVLMWLAVSAGVLAVWGLVDGRS